MPSSLKKYGVFVSAFAATTGVSLSAESDEGLCPSTLQAFEKACAKLLAV